MMPLLRHGTDCNNDHIFDMRLGCKSCHQAAESVRTIAAPRTLLASYSLLAGARDGDETLNSLRYTREAGSNPGGRATSSLD